MTRRSQIGAGRKIKDEFADYAAQLECRLTQRPDVRPPRSPTLPRHKAAQRLARRQMRSSPRASAMHESETPHRDFANIGGAGQRPNRAGSARVEWTYCYSLRPTTIAWSTGGALASNLTNLK
jgi:hypothetical protein